MRGITDGHCLHNEAPSRRSATPSTRSSGRPTTGWAAAARARATGTWRTAGTRRGSDATSCCRRSTPSRARRLDQPRRAQPRLERLAVPPAEAYGVATFYALLSTTPRPPVVAHVCDDIACRLAGAERARATTSSAGSGRRAAPRTAARPGCAARASASASARRPRMVTVAGAQPRERTRRPPADARRGSRAALAGRRRRRGRAAGDRRPAGGRRRRCGCCGASGASTRRASTTTARTAATRRCARALEIGPGRRDRARSPTSKLVGRGGAAFPTGRKWEAVARQPAQPHYLVCNADESEPGTFKDRVLMEGDPFALVEAMTIAGFATGCERGYLYLRGEYPLARGAARATPSTRRAARGCLGDGRPGPGLRVRHRAAARAPAPTSAARRRRSSSRSRATAASRATSRRSRSRSGCSASRPPSTTSRRWSTCRSILRAAARPTRRSAPRVRPGPKLFCVSGHVERPGVYEAPFGVDAAASCSTLAGGVAGGRAHPGDPARRRGRACSSGPTSSTCR